LFPVRCLFEAVANIFVCSVLAAGAVTISLGVEALSARQIDPLLVIGLRGAEYAVFASDLVLFGRFLWNRSSNVGGNLT
jgi:hypothetical protein